MGRRDEDDEFEVYDARQEKYVPSGGGGSALELPEGVRYLKTDREGVYVLEFIPFMVTESHLRFAEKFPAALQFSRPGAWYGERTYFRHENVGPDRAKFICPWMNFGKACPICEERQRLSKSTNERDRSASYDIKPKERQLFLVLERDEETWDLKSTKLQLLEISAFALGKQLDLFIKAAPPKMREAYRAYYHPNKGFTVRLAAAKEKMGEKKGGNDGGGGNKGGGGSWNKFTVVGFDPRQDPIPKDVFKHGIDLDAMVKEADYDTIKRAYFGIEDEPKNDDSGDNYSPPPRQEERPPQRQERKPDPVPEPQPKREAPKIEKKPEPVKVDGFASKDVVSFDRKGDTLQGEITKIDAAKEIATVWCEERGRDFVLDFEEMIVVKRDDTFDAKPEKQPAGAINQNGRPKRVWDDEDGDEDDGRTVARTSKK